MTHNRKKNKSKCLGIFSLLFSGKERKIHDNLESTPKIHKPVHVLVEEQNIQNEKIKLLTMKKNDLHEKNYELKRVVECWQNKYSDLKKKFEQETTQMIEQINKQEKLVSEKNKEIEENKISIGHLLEQNQYLEKDVNTELQKTVMDLEEKIKSLGEANGDLSLQCKDLLQMNTKLENENDELRSTLKELYTSINDTREVNNKRGGVVNMSKESVITPLKGISNIYSTSYQEKMDLKYGTESPIPVSSSYNSKYKYSGLNYNQK